MTKRSVVTVIVVVRVSRSQVLVLAFGVVTAIPPVDKLVENDDNIEDRAVGRLDKEGSMTVFDVEETEAEPASAEDVFSGETSVVVVFSVVGVGASAIGMVVEALVLTLADSRGSASEDGVGAAVPVSD